MTLQDFTAPDVRQSTSVQIRGCSCPTCKAMEKVATGDIDLGIVDTIPGGPTSTAVVTPGTPFIGYISPATDTDVVRLNAVAGQTYMITLRGTGPNPIDDPFLELINPAFTAYIAYDDDGGAGVTSLINFTATANATYFIRASSFTNPGQPPEPGQYQIDVRLVPTVDTVSANPHVSNPTLTVGETFFAFAETSGDADMFQVHLEAGKVYSFETAGGYDYLTVGTTGFPAGREIDTRLALFDPNGNFVAFNDDINGSDWSSGTSYFATQTGTYFLRVFPYAGSIGGYTVDVKEMAIDLNANPLDAIDWGTQLSVDTVKVYFAAAGESFGGSGVSLGWTTYEIGRAMAALETYEHYIDLDFEITTVASEATFKMVSVQNVGFLGRFGPPGTGAFAGVGEFAVDDATWDRTGATGNLEQGGYGFVTLIHELGHGLGLAHPHDNGGTSSVMEGVFGAFFSYGVFNMNQGVYTMMSYNTGWHTQPGVPFGQPPASVFLNRGAEGTPGSLDIALLQQKYGANPTANAGDTVYLLDPANAPGTHFEAIWDTSGNDTIVHNGSAAAQIDLTAATLDYSPTGAGVVSFVDGVYGGYTIANGVVIENATGGSGADSLIGNAAANVLTGNGGDDILLGRDGNDILLGGGGADRLIGGDGVDRFTGGAGADVFVAEINDTKVASKDGPVSLDIILDFQQGIDKIDVSDLGAFTWKGNAANKNAGDLSIKTFGNVNAAEKALGIDIDGVDGASPFSGHVTVVFGNIDGGAPDFLLVLTGTPTIGSIDFIFA